MSNEQQWNDIRQLVTDIAAKNMIDVQANFDKIMGGKLGDALAVRRSEVATSIYGKAPQAGSEDEHQDDDGSGDAE